MNSDVATRQDRDGIASRMRPANKVAKIYPKYKLVAEAQVIKNNVDQDPGHTTTGV